MKFECQNCGEKYIQDVDGYWDSISCPKCGSRLNRKIGFGTKRKEPEMY